MSTRKKRSLAQTHPVSKEAIKLKHQLFGDTNYEPPAKKQRLNRKNKNKNSDKPAWVDPDDNNITINIKKKRKLRHLRNTFDEEELNATEYIQRQRKHYQQSIEDDWTKDPNKSDTDNDDDNKDPHNNKFSSFQRSIRITAQNRDIISNSRIAYTNLGSINSRNCHSSVITVCEYNSTGSILITAGLDKTLNLYSMYGKNNELLKKIFIKDLPIRCARFTSDNKEIIITGRRYYFYVFDLINFKLNRINKLIGRDERSWEYFEVSPNNLHIIFIGVRGSIVIVSRITKKPIKIIQINDQISSIKFNFNGSVMYILTQNGVIYIYNMDTFRCIDKIIFDGIVKSTSFDIYSSLNIIAIGCNSGVVSMYYYEFNKNDTNILLDINSNNNNNNNISSIKPIYCINNLITTITDISFNHDAQLMVIYSKNKKQAIRLIHVETGKVYSNWPKDKGLSYIYKAKFSPNSGYLAVGTDIGFVKLIRLHFYGQL